LKERKSAAVVRGITALAHEIGIPTTAEGVETKQQLDFLRDCGCTHAQGFLLGRPARAESIARIGETIEKS
jgi:diguanylate cyclase